MKGCILLGFIIVLFVSASGATKTAVANGDWSTGSTWSPAGVPGSGDDIVIPAGTIVMITTDIVVLFNLAINTVTISGTLVLNTAGLALNSFDVLTVLSGGVITSSGIGGFISSGLNPPITSFPIPGPAVITGGSLPVTVLYFKARQSGDEVILEWASATEEKFDYYRIERSLDGQKFEELIKIKGAGFSQIKKEYSALDKQPISGTVYYRLVAVDLDGSNQDFGIISVKVNLMEKKISVFPNPLISRDRLSLIPNFQTTENDKLTIFNGLGQIVYEASLMTDGSIDINTENYGKGIHILVLQSAQYGRFIEKIIFE